MRLCRLWRQSATPWRLSTRAWAPPRRRERSYSNRWASLRRKTLNSLTVTAAVTVKPNELPSDVTLNITSSTEDLWLRELVGWEDVDGVVFFRSKRTTKKLPAWRDSMYSEFSFSCLYMWNIFACVCIHCVCLDSQRSETGRDKSQRRSDSSSRTQRKLRVTEWMPASHLP